MKLAKLFTVLAAGVFLWGCGKKEAETAVRGMQNYLTDKDLQGTFVGKCESSGLPGIQSQVSQTFKGGNFTSEKIFYAENDCSKDELGRAVYRGGFKIAKEKYEGAEARTIDISVDKATIKIKSDVLVKAANAVKYCGVSAFEIGKDYDVTPNTQQANCFVATVPVTYYGTYKITKEKGVTLLNLSDPDISRFATVKGERRYRIETEPAGLYTKK
jgi:hypothetical protein